MTIIWRVGRRSVPLAGCSRSQTRSPMTRSLCAASTSTASSTVAMNDGAAIRPRGPVVRSAGQIGDRRGSWEGRGVTTNPAKRPKPRIFVSYRRDDAPGYALRVYDAIAEHFGHEYVFLDIDDIDPGVDFTEV